MKWNKKGIDKPVEKKSILDTRLLGIVKKFKPEMLSSAEYQTRRLTQIVLLDAEHRKAEALTLIHRESLM